MIDFLGDAVGLLASGAGGGILGGIFGLGKQFLEQRERKAMAQIELQRDQAEYANAKEEREHAKIMLEAGARIEIEKIQTETEAEIEVAHQKSLSAGQRAEFGSLDTTSGMDNYRSSVRPTLAYWAWALFNAMLCWAFYEFADQIDAGMGLKILLGLFATLNFTVSSIVTFYYVSRSNRKPQS